MKVPGFIKRAIEHKAEDVAASKVDTPAEAVDVATRIVKSSGGTMNPTVKVWLTAVVSAAAGAATQAFNNDTNPLSAQGFQRCAIAGIAAAFLALVGLFMHKPGSGSADAIVKAVLDAIAKGNLPQAHLEALVGAAAQASEPPPVVPLRRIKAIR